MKIQSAILTLTILSAFVLPFSLVAISRVNADMTGNCFLSKTKIYAVITNYLNMDVPMDQNVTATAGTTDMTVNQIEFVWQDPNGTVVFNDTVKVSGPLTTPEVPPSNIPSQAVNWANDNPGVKYLYAQDTQMPNATGTWCVKALFYAQCEHGQCQCHGSDVVQVKATSFTQVPENPAIVTLGAAAALLLAMGLYRKKNQK